MVGGIFVAAGLATEQLDLDPAVVLVCTLVFVVLAGSIFPWLALGATGTNVDQLFTVADITADPDDIDPEQVGADARTAHEILVGVSATVGLLLVLVAPLAVSRGVAGTLLAVMACLVVMLRTRQYRTGAEVLVGLASGSAGAALGRRRDALAAPRLATGRRGGALGDRARCSWPPRCCRRPRPCVAGDSATSPRRWRCCPSCRCWSSRPACWTRSARNLVATKRDLVEAHQFSRRRLVTAFVSGAPGGREVEPARPGRALIGGLALALLVVAGGAVTGLIFGRDEADWKQPGLVISKDLGQPYLVSTPEGGGLVIRPVVNITSARLILGADADPTYVSEEAINAERIGEPIGIIDAPAQVPDPDDLVETGWTACTSVGTGLRLRLADAAGRGRGAAALGSWWRARASGTSSRRPPPPAASSRARTPMRCRATAAPRTTCCATSG